MKQKTKTGLAFVLAATFAACGAVAQTAQNNNAPGNAPPGAGNARPAGQFSGNQFMGPSQKSQTPPPPPQPVPQAGFVTGQNAGSAANSNAANPNQIPLNGIQPLDNQAIMNQLAVAGSDQAVSDEENRRKTVEAALNGLFPLKSEEIRELIDRLHNNQKAVEEPQVGTPKIEIKAETVPLEPGSQPLNIEMDVGFITTVSFLDSTGSPWPIEDIGVGGNFDVPAPDQGGNVLRMTPLAKYAVGNMSVRLAGLITPLSFTLRASTGTIYYRYDARVPKLGPKAQAPLIRHGNDLVAGDGLLMSILDGMPPMDSTRLNVIGADGRTGAWRVGDQIYVRTPHILLSPGWVGSVGSGDGTHVYQVADTPVLLLSDNGSLIHARIGNNALPDEQPVPSIEDGMAHPHRTSTSETDTGSSRRLVDRSNEMIATPTGSRTVIRPVAVGGAAQGSSRAQAADGTGRSSNATSSSQEGQP